jgi:hypothetical protein
MYNIVEAWVWSLHWRLKGKQSYESKKRELQLEALIDLYSKEIEDKKDGE